MLRRVKPAADVATALIEPQDSDLYLANIFVCATEDPAAPQVGPVPGAFSIAILEKGVSVPDDRWVYRSVKIAGGETFVVSGIFVPAGASVVVKSAGSSHLVYTATGQFA